MLLKPKCALGSLGGLVKTLLTLISPHFPSTPNPSSGDSRSPQLLDSLGPGCCPRIHIYNILHLRLLPVVPRLLSDKEFSCNAGDLGWNLGSGGYFSRGFWNPFQCSCPENPMDRGAWQAIVHRVARVGHNPATDTSWEPLVQSLW